MLVVRGTPSLILYRRDLDLRGRGALALLSSTQLPLVLAITEVATASGRMSPSTAADLVGAALLSTLIFPLLGLRLRRAPVPRSRDELGRLRLRALAHRLWLPQMAQRRCQSTVGSVRARLHRAHAGSRVEPRSARA